MYVTLLHCNLWKVSSRLCLLSPFYFFGRCSEEKNAREKSHDTHNMPAGDEIVVPPSMLLHHFALVLRLYGFFSMCFSINCSGQNNFFLFAIGRKLYGFINHKWSGECCSRRQKKWEKPQQKYEHWYMVDFFSLETKTKWKKRRQRIFILLLLFGNEVNEKFVSFFIFLADKNTTPPKKNIEKISADIYNHNE